jgi:hypothetical protein
MDTATGNLQLLEQMVSAIEGQGQHHLVAKGAEPVGVDAGHITGIGQRAHRQARVVPPCQSLKGQHGTLPQDAARRLRSGDAHDL